MEVEGDRVVDWILSVSFARSGGFALVQFDMSSVFSSLLYGLLQLGLPASGLLLHTHTHTHTHSLVNTGLSTLGQRSHLCQVV